MTAVLAQRQYEWDGRRSDSVIHWICAALFAGMLHVAVVWAAIHWMQPVVMQDSPSAVAEAIQIPMALELVQDLQPAAVQPEEQTENKTQAAPPETSEVKAEPEPVETTAEETEPRDPEIVEPKPAEPKPAEPEKAEAEPPKPEKPEPLQAEKQSDLPRSDDKAAEPAAAVKPRRKVVTPKPPLPTPARVAPARSRHARVAPPPVVRRRPVAKARPAPTPSRRAERQAAEAARASAAAAARASAAAAAAGRAAAAAASAAASSASWRASLMAHLNRYKRFPPGASAGVVSVSFTIDRSGGVRAAHLARSSGNSILDAEAVAMVRRASPVPAPPAGVGGSLMAIAVPIRFSR